MPLKLKVPDPNQSFELPSEGSHPAALVAAIDLGTQENTYQGVTTVAHKVFLAFELLGEEKEEGGPFIMGRDYTFSLNEKANLREVVKALRGGKDMAPDEELELSALLGKPCIVAIEHGKTSKDVAFAKITRVTPPMKGQKSHPHTCKPVCWEIDSGEVFPNEDWLPFLYGKPLREVVERSAEWKQGGAKAALDEIEL